MNRLTMAVLAGLLLAVPPVLLAQPPDYGSPADIRMPSSSSSPVGRSGNARALQPGALGGNGVGVTGRDARSNSLRGPSAQDAPGNRGTTGVNGSIMGGGGAGGGTGSAGGGTGGPGGGSGRAGY